MRADRVEEPFDPRHSQEVERLLALARLAVVAALFLSFAWATQHFILPVGRTLVAAYAAFAIVVAAILGIQPGLGARARRALHLADFGFALAIAATTGGTSSNAYPLFAYVLVAGAYRWGFGQAVFDGSCIGGLSIVMAGAAAGGLTPWPFEADLFALRLGYTLILALLFGALSERQHMLARQATALARVVAQIGRSSDLATAIRETLESIVRLLGARRAFLVIEEADTRRLFFWRVDHSGHAPVVTASELLPAMRSVWLTPLPDGISACAARRRAGQSGGAPVRLGLDEEGRVTLPDFDLPHPLAGEHAWTSLLTVSLHAQNGGLGRLYLLDVPRRPFEEAWLQFLQTLTRQAAPSVLSLYLLQGMRSRIGARERARVSLELHDGVVQALIALEMRLDVLRRRAESIAVSFAPELAELGTLLHQEIVGVRELMQRLRPASVDAERLPYELRDLVERFSRAAQIDATLEWAAPRFDLPPRVCRELVRIVQEALVNVERHSGASTVQVRVESDAGGWGVVVQDDGRGLGFSGRFEHADLVAQARGPRVIRERVAALGGSLAIESSPEGVRLEMGFPRVRE